MRSCCYTILIAIVRSLSSLITSRQYHQSNFTRLYSLTDATGSVPYSPKNPWLPTKVKPFIRVCTVLPFTQRTLANSVLFLGLFASQQDPTIALQNTDKNVSRVKPVPSEEEGRSNSQGSHRATLTPLGPCSPPRP